MQMFPWEKQILKCKLDFDNIKIYNVPKNIDLEINGWGTGKFTNNQYFGSKAIIKVSFYCNIKYIFIMNCGH